MATKNQKIIFSVLALSFFQVFTFPAKANAETPPTQVWVARYDGGTPYSYSSDTANKITVDKKGNVYVVGQSADDIVTVKYSNTGAQVWVARYNGSGNGVDSPADIKVDNAGNVYVTGTIFEGNVNHFDYVTIKYDVGGAQLWAVKYNGIAGANDFVASLAIDSNGNIYVTGNSGRLYGTSYYDYSTIKYDSNGNQLWVAIYNGPNSYNTNYVSKIIVDNFDNVYVAGTSNSDYLAIKYDTRGNQLWLARYNGGYVDEATGMVVDTAGNVYIFGDSWRYPNEGGGGYLVVKYDKDGNKLLTVKHLAPEWWIVYYPADLAVDASENIYITGSGGTVKYDKNGAQIWGIITPISRISSVTLDESNNVYIAGSTDFYRLSDRDYVIIKYDSGGNELWRVFYNGTGNHGDILTDLFMDESGQSIYVTGHSLGDNGTSDDFATVKYTFSLLQFWSLLQNSSQGWLALRNTPGTQNKPVDDIIKILPNDWVLKVATTTDASRNPIELDGYQWYGVVDVADNAIGWMTAKEVISGTEYLSYDANAQTLLEAKATTTPYQTKESRIPVIIQAVDDYYTASTTSNSLYSGGGGVGNKNNFQTFIQGSQFPKELVLAIASQESGSVTSVGFNNEIVTFDYGHGIMQATFAASNTNLLKNEWDNRGVGSSITIPLCKSIFSNDYKKCYANSETPNNLQKPYQHYDGNPANPVYKQYANTLQSIYANIKDGFRVIQDKFRKKCPKADTVISGYIFTCQDIEKMLTVWGYNGFGKDRNTGLYTGTYLKDVAGKLENISSYFPSISYADVDFIQRMKIANAHKQVIKVYSPVTFYIIDSAGLVTGLVNDALFEEIPNSLYERSAEGAVIFFPSNSYKYRVIGTTTGTYGFSVDDVNNDIVHTFRATDIPTTLGEIHEYAIDWDALDRGERGVTVRIDTNGDGIVDRVVQSDSTLTEIMPPIVTTTSPSGEYLLNATTSIQFIAADPSGIATTTANMNGVSVINGQTVKLTKAGANTFEVSAMDNEGNTATATNTFSVVYNIKGFFSPLDSDKKEIEVHQERTIPVRFKLRDVNGKSVSGVKAVLYVAKIINGVVGIDEIPYSNSDRDDGDDEKTINQFRYDSEGKLYIFNLSTKTMTSGMWQIKAVLDSGQEIKARVLIKQSSHEE